MRPLGDTWGNSEITKIIFNILLPVWNKRHKTSSLYYDNNIMWLRFVPSEDVEITTCADERQTDPPLSSCRKYGKQTVPCKSAPGLTCNPKARVERIRALYILCVRNQRAETKENVKLAGKHPGHVKIILIDTTAGAGGAFRNK